MAFFNNSRDEGTPMEREAQVKGFYQGEDSLKGLAQLDQILDGNNMELEGLPGKKVEEFLICISSQK